MARPLRIEFAGALYHITSRGDGREDIYLDDVDREQFLAVLAQVCDRFNWICHSYCLMSNHYHALVETVNGNLSQGMRQLNGVYTQNFNSCGWLSKTAHSWRITHSITIEAGEQADPFTA